MNDPPEMPIARPAGAGTISPLRIPGAVNPEAYSIVLDRLLEAWVMSSTINRQAGEAYRMALKIATVAAPYGAHGTGVEKVLQALTKRLEQHLATLPDVPRPPTAT